MMSRHDLEKTSCRNARHAYCIIAHSDPYCLQNLLRSIDDERNDVYLLIDKKTGPDLEKGLATYKSSLNIIPLDKRIDIRWGGLSQVKAELLLFKTAINSGDYSYIHLISGADLPLKSQNYIHSFFSSLTPGTNIVTFSHGEAIRKNVEFKTRYYHPFVENQRFRKDGNPGHLLKDFTAKLFRQLSVKSQKAVGYRRKWVGLELKKGSQWVSITKDLAKYLVAREEFILRKFRGVICSDEIFLHTMIFNSPYAGTIWDYKGEKTSTRHIDWKRGTPYVWREEDFDELIKSEALFARKFSSEKDKAIIDMITRKVLSDSGF